MAVRLGMRSKQNEGGEVTTVTAATELIDHQCPACATGVLKMDKFCRRCGARQSNRYNTAEEMNHLSESETKPLNSSTGELQTYSGQLLKIVTTGLASKTESATPANRGVQRLVCTLIALPLWMLIVALSPLDAYIAAKTAAGYMR